MEEIKNIIPPKPRFLNWFTKIIIGLLAVNILLFWYASGSSLRNDFVLSIPWVSILSIPSFVLLLFIAIIWNKVRIILWNRKQDKK